MNSAPQKTFSGKVILVTGSSSGIGQGIATAFAEAGASVVITGRNAAGLEKTRKACLGVGAKENEVLSVVGDITDERFRAELTEKTTKKFGKIDILINNAGMFLQSPLADSANSDFMDAYSKTFALNVTAAVDLTKKCLNELISSKGNIINISSFLGTKAQATGLAYCMSKAALDMFTKCLALELGPKGVRANCIRPGAVETAMLDAGRSKMVNSMNMSVEKANEIFANVSVLGLIGAPKDIASLALFLASDNANFVTGSSFDINGGALLK